MLIFNFFFIDEMAQGDSPLSRSQSVDSIASASSDRLSHQSVEDENQRQLFSDDLDSVCFL